MKLSCKRIVTTVTIVLILMCIVLSVSYREYAKRDASLKSDEYSCAAEPPVRGGVSHLSRRNEPL